MNKMIYVADRDAYIFDRAQELSQTSLSSTVVQALRLYIEREDAKRADLKEIRLRMYKNGSFQVNRFYGRRLMRYRYNHTPTELCELSIYITAKGRYAAYRRLEPDWSTDNTAQGPGHEVTYEITSTLDTYNTLDTLAESLPEAAAQRLRDVVAMDAVVDLDI